MAPHVLWARGLGVRVWAHETVQKAVREVVCRGGSTGPPSPTIGRGKGGAEEPPPRRQRPLRPREDERGVMAVGLWAKKPRKAKDTFSSYGT